MLYFYILKIKLICRQIYPKAKWGRIVEVKEFETFEVERVGTFLVQTDNYHRLKSTRRSS